MEQDLTQQEERLLTTLQQPQRTEDELKRISDDARKRGRTDFAFAVMEIMDERFPNWSAPTTPPLILSSHATSAIFKGMTRQFDSANAAYSWLFESMIVEAKVPCSALTNDEFLNKVACGKRGARYVAVDFRDLFPGNTGRAANSANYDRLSNGWYLNLKLDNHQKDGRLYALSTFCNLKLGDDWSWTAVPSLEELLAGIS